MTRPYNLRVVKIASASKILLHDVAKNFGFKDRRVLENWEAIVGRDFADVVHVVAISANPRTGDSVVKIHISDLSVWSHWRLFEAGIACKIEEILGNKVIFKVIKR